MPCVDAHLARESAYDLVVRLAFCELPSRPAMHRGVAAPWGNLRSLCYERLQARNAAAGHRIAAFVLSAAVHSWIEADVGSARVWYAKTSLAELS